MKKATFPTMGHYTESFAMMIKDLGFEPIIPPKTNQETVNIRVIMLLELLETGVRNA